MLMIHSHGQLQVHVRIFPYRQISTSLCLSGMQVECYSSFQSLCEYIIPAVSSFAKRLLPCISYPFSGYEIHGSDTLRYPIIIPSFFTSPHPSSVSLPPSPLSFTPLFHIKKHVHHAVSVHRKGFQNLFQKTFKNFRPVPCFTRSMMIMF